MRSYIFYEAFGGCLWIIFKGILIYNPVIGSLYLLTPSVIVYTYYKSFLNSALVAQCLNTSHRQANDQHWHFFYSYVQNVTPGGDTHEDKTNSCRIVPENFTMQISGYFVT